MEKLVVGIIAVGIRSVHLLAILGIRLFDCVIEVGAGLYLLKALGLLKLIQQ